MTLLTVSFSSVALATGVQLVTYSLLLHTVMILNFQTDRSGQTLQTQIRLQSDQGLHYLLLHLHVFDKIPSGLVSLFEFDVNYSKVSCVRKFMNFTVFVMVVLPQVSPDVTKRCICRVLVLDSS